MVPLVWKWRCCRRYCRRCKCVCEHLARHTKRYVAQILCCNDLESSVNFGRSSELPPHYPNAIPTPASQTTILQDFVQDALSPRKRRHMDDHADEHEGSPTKRARLDDKELQQVLVPDEAAQSVFRGSHAPLPTSQFLFTIVSLVRSNAFTSSLII